MSDIERYTLDIDNGLAVMNESNEGVWVRHVHHKRAVDKVEQELHDYKSIVSQLKEQLKEAGLE